jgi:peptide/nickel transport system substrate-binding protein
MNHARPARRLLTWTTALVAAAAIAGAVQAQTLTYVMAGGWDTLDPNRTTFFRVGRTMIHVVEPMLWQVAPGEFAPGLVTEWSVNGDATAYTLKLKEGVTFHDGTPFNAAAVQFTYDRIVDPATGSRTARTILGPYARTEIVNDHEVVIHFSRSFGPFLNSLSYPYLGIVSPTAYARVGFDEWGNSELVGSGPFMLESYEPNARVVLVRNPDYDWAPEHFGVSGPAFFERIVFEMVTEPTPRVGSLLTGESQFIEDVPELDEPMFSADPRFRMAAIPFSGSGWSLMFNQEKSPTDELAVRRAVQLASDGEGILLTVFDGFGQVACSPITSNMPYYDDATCDMYPFDPEAAQQVLEDAGWVDANGDGFRERDGTPLVIEHYYQSNNPKQVQIAEFMQTDLAAIGIRVNLNGLTGAGYMDAVRRGDHNTQNWLQTGTDPDILRNNFHSSNIGSSNQNRYADAEMDRLLDDAAAAADPAVRRLLYSQIQRKIKDEAVMIYYLDPLVLFAHSERLQNPYFYLSSIFPYFYPASFTGN